MKTRALGLSRTGWAPKPGRSVVLNVATGESYVAIVDEVARNPSGSFTWSGYIASDPEGSAAFVVRGPRVAGHIVAHGRHFVVEPTRRGLHVIYRLNESELRPEAPPIPIDAGPRPLPEAADDGSSIDVLVAYTPSARSNRGGTAAVQATIESAVAWTNGAYERSGISTRIRLAHMVEVSYTESSSGMATDLVKLRGSSDGDMDEVHSLRDTYGADMVALITENSPYDYCGIGYLMTSVTTGFAPWAFTVTDGRCLPATLAHELGHNQGMHHDRYVTSGSGAYSYSYGYVDTTARWRTVMAYSSECSDLGISCGRIQNFSNPGVNYDGRPTGVSTASASSAHNARTLNNTAYTVSNFRRETVVLPGAPVPTAPSGTISTGSPTYEWTGDTSATSYSLEVQDSGNATVFSQSYSSSFCSGTSCSVSGATNLSSGSYGFRVRASNSAGSSAWSSMLSFTVSGGGGGGDAPTLISPNGTVDDSTPTYLWNGVSVSGLNRYQVQVTRAGGGTVYDDGYDPNSCSAGTCSLTPSTALADGSYTWHVRARGSSGWGPWSADMSFTVDDGGGGGGGGADAPTLISPNGTVDDSTPTYLWNGVSVSGLNRYQVQVTRAGGGTVYDDGYDPNSCSAGTCSLTPSTALADGSYTWHVRARGSSGWGPWSADMSFTVDDDGGGGGGGVPGMTTLIGPSGSINTGNPTFRWTGDSSATAYLLHVVNAAGVLVHGQWYEASSVCAGTSCSVSNATDLADGDYVFGVLGGNDAGHGPWPTPMSFTVQ